MSSRYCMVLWCLYSGHLWRVLSLGSCSPRPPRVWFLAKESTTSPKQRSWHSWLPTVTETAAECCGNAAAQVATEHAIDATRRDLSGAEDADPARVNQLSHFHEVPEKSFLQIQITTICNTWNPDQIVKKMRATWIPTKECPFVPKVCQWMLKV